MPSRLLAVAALLVVAGCVGRPAPVEDQIGGAETTYAPVSVIGFVDSGINPYHDVFARPGADPPPVLDARTGQPPVTIPLTQEGTFAERLAADESLWEGLQPDVLYWFEGTNIMALALGTRGSDNPVILDRTGHGTAIAGVASLASPESYLVMVQDDGRDEGDTVAALLSIPSGIRWLAEQPWVDVISLSIGLQANPPLFWEAFDFPQATHEAAQRGKMIVVGVANLPVLSVWSGTAGPPWVVAVGGAQGAAKGETAHATRLADVVADYAQPTARANSTHEMAPDGGTSLSTPVVASAIARTLHELRENSHGCCDTSPPRLREALNASAVYWNTTDWKPIISEDIIETIASATLPILPTPWVQMGWGYVGDETWKMMAAHLRGEPVPVKPQAAKDYMALQHRLRETYWEANPLLNMPTSADEA